VSFGCEMLLELLILKTNVLPASSTSTWNYFCYFLSHLELDHLWWGSSKLRDRGMWLGQWQYSYEIWQSCTQPSMTGAIFLRGCWRVPGWIPRSSSVDITNGVKWCFCLKYGSSYLHLFACLCCARTLSGSLWHWDLALVFVTHTSIQYNLFHGPKSHAQEYHRGHRQWVNWCIWLGQAL
jgi:hypothetical protein